jgi:hypothetical protein
MTASRTTRVLGLAPWQPYCAIVHLLDKVRSVLVDCRKRRGDCHQPGDGHLPALIALDQNVAGATTALDFSTHPHAPIKRLAVIDSAVAMVDPPAGRDVPLWGGMCNERRPRFSRSAATRLLEIARPGERSRIHSPKFAFPHRPAPPGDSNKENTP